MSSVQEGNLCRADSDCEEGYVCNARVEDSYCSKAGKVCGWPLTEGLEAGQEQLYLGETYICRGEPGAGRLVLKREGATACTMIYKPVCGTDGKTYPNACVAESRGVEIAGEGECSTFREGR